MKKIMILLATLASLSLVLSSCKLNYKTEGTSADMHFKTNIAEYNAAPDSIWELNAKYKTNMGTLDDGKYSVYKCELDAISSVLRVDNYTAQSPYPKFFINQKCTFPEFKLENIYLVKFFNVDSYKKYLSTETSASAIDEWQEPELIKKLYDAVIQRDNKAEQYPDFESYPKLGFLEWNCAEFVSLVLLTDVIQINNQYFIIVRYGYDDHPRELIQIETDVAEYLLSHATVPANSLSSGYKTFWIMAGAVLAIVIIFIILVYKARR